LFRVEWVPSSLPAKPPAGELALLGSADPAVEALLEGAGHTLGAYRDLPALIESLATDTAPSRVLADQARRTPDDGLLKHAHGLGRELLELLQGWVAEARLSDSCLVILTRGAVAATDLDGLAQSPLWGLVRSAQAEHPGRFRLIDLDPHEVSTQALAAALGSDEPQSAVKGGEVLVPRLVRVARTSAPESDSAGDVHGTVLITGGTGALGSLLARHLATARRVGHLLLASRQGAQAAGAGELCAELEGLGAQVTLAACDVADRDQLRRLLDSIPQQQPLTAVVHAAGVIDDGILESLTAERLDRVLAAKLDAAWHLHELTADAQLRTFALFSSAAGVLGAPGQGNYAAANAFLDGLAARRRGQGLPGISLAWGPWEELTGLTENLSELDRSRIRRVGFGSISTARGLELFDTALATGEAALLPLVLDLPALRAQARVGALPAILTGLVPSVRRRVDEQRESLLRRLAATPEAAREGLLLEVVREHVANVLGHAGVEAVDRNSSFKELGFDSLAAVELRNRLSAATGLRMPATLVFDYPTPEATASYLGQQLGGATTARGAIDEEFDKLEEFLAAVVPEPDAHERLEVRWRALSARMLRVLANGHELDGGELHGDGGDPDLDTDDDVFAFLDSRSNDTDSRSTDVDSRPADTAGSQVEHETP
jgi:acyl carrier protein/NADP-dependent 3-hydroxy acid dehydrogenase YdfG